MLHIVVNCAKDALRKRKINTEALTDNLCAPEVPPEDESLAAALNALPKGLRLTVTLHYLEGLSIAEIARVMRAPQGTVKNYLFRGRKHLARTLEKYRKEDESWK